MSPEETFETATLNSTLPSTETQLRAEVFVRSLAPISRKQTQDDLVKQLEVLAETGQLADVDLHVWGDSVCTASPLSEVGCGQRIVDAIGEFYELAADSSVSIAPFFTVSEVAAKLPEESFRRIVPPSECVAFYDDSELVGVFPSVIEDTTYTPRDALRYLAARHEETARVAMVDESA